MGNEKQLKEDLEKAVIVIKDLNEKLENSSSNENQKLIEKLETELEEKNNKIVELAESVAKTQPPPRRVHLDMKYSNKYTPTQIKAFKKNGISTENLDTEPDPEESEITA